MWSTDPIRQLQLANADHRERIAVAALRRASSVEMENLHEPSAHGHHDRGRP